MSDEPYFLSAANPLATIDQRDAEARAIRIFATPALRLGVQRASYLWRLAYGVDVCEQAEPMFADAMEEYAFNYLLKAIASDGNFPLAIRLFMPPHKWFARQVPGSRMGGDNPDNCYRVIGIHHSVRYEIEGRVCDQPPSSLSFTLVSNFGTSKTIQTLDFNDIELNDDRTFTLVVDDQPGNGRINHLRSVPGVKFLFVRDSLQDWNNQTPVALRVKRIDPPDAPPLTDAQIAERAVAAMTDDVYLYYWFTRNFTGKPVNTMTSPMSSGSVGGLVTQASSTGWYKLGPDDAYLIRIDPAGADYCGLVAHDWWFRSADSWACSSSLTTAMMHPDGDGCYSAVLSLQDPGIHNWLNPNGLRSILLLCRWQSLPAVQVNNGPSLTVQKVQIQELAKLLPSDTLTVNAQARQQQLEARKTAFNKRLIWS